MSRPKVLIEMHFVLRERRAKRDIVEVHSGSLTFGLLMHVGQLLFPKCLLKTTAFIYESVLMEAKLN